MAFLLLALHVPPAAAETTRHALQVGTATRSYWLHVPARRADQARLPLVFAFHGAGSNARDLMRGTGLDDVADREGFVVVYPEAVSSVGQFDAGTLPEAMRARLPDDMAFVRALLASLKRSLPIDEGRIYATGFSNGGMFCYRLAAEMSETFAAIAPVSAAMGSGVTAVPTRGVSVLHVHGVGDDRVPLGPRPGRNRSIDETIATWVRYDEASPEPKIERLRPAPGLSLTRRIHAAGPKGASVVLYLVDGMGHWWPSAGRHWITRTIWSFFNRHAR